MKRQFIILITIFITINLVQPFGFDTIQSGLTDVLKSGTNTGKAIGSKIPDLIPSPDTLFNLGKQALLGYPLEALTSVINEFCSIAISGNGTIPQYTPNVTDMSFVFFTDMDNISIPLLESERLWSHPKFNKEWNTTLLITGWTTDLNEQDTTIDTFLKAYRARGDTNFIVLDSARFVDTLYTWSAFNTEDIGEHVGIALAKLINVVPLSKVHVIGHSLGSHIAGAAARSFNVETKRLLPRVTGLDPANPCFNEGEKLSGLHRGDADFIDVIHTNPGVLGKRDPIGDIDFYPNGVNSIQPGCVTITCAHARAWELFTETLYPGNENNFLATRCSSLSSLNIGKCPGSKIPMGIAVPQNIKGNYFFKTKSSSPFGDRS